MTNLGDFAALIPGDHGLCVVSTLRPDASIQSTVVNGGVVDHPVTGQPCVGFVARGDSRKISYLRLRPQATIVVRAGWQWVAAEGQVDLIGPDDPRDSVDSEAIRLLLREIFSAAGGSHDDWDTYDRVMADERRTAALLTPRRIYSNS